MLSDTTSRCTRSNQHCGWSVWLAHLPVSFDPEASSSPRSRTCDEFKLRWNMLNASFTFLLLQLQMRCHARARYQRNCLRLCKVDRFDRVVITPQSSAKPELPGVRPSVGNRPPGVFCFSGVAICSTSSPFAKGICCCPLPLAADDADFMTNVPFGFGCSLYLTSQRFTILPRSNTSIPCCLSPSFRHFSLSPNPTPLFSPHFFEPACCSSQSDPEAFFN